MLYWNHIEDTEYKYSIKYVRNTKSLEILTATKKYPDNYILTLNVSNYQLLLTKKNTICIL